MKWSTVNCPLTVADDLDNIRSHTNSKKFQEKNFRKPVRKIRPESFAFFPIRFVGGVLCTAAKFEKSD